MCGPITGLLAGLCLLAPPAHAFEGRVLDSVVSVLPRWPAEPASPEVAYARRMRPEGSAVAVLAGGYLATNVHVVRGALSVRVRLRDGRILPAEVVGLDPETDIALLRAPLDLPPLAPAPEPALGDPVCAVGNPFGLGLSVTCGVVSGLHRAGIGFNPIEDFVQTDAVVNPGGSGGALVDARGRLVGLVSAIFNKQVDADIGVNFAASAALVMRVATDLVRHGRVVRGRLGARLVDVPEAERARLVGARVVSATGAAARAGLQSGDVIVGVAGRPVRSAAQVRGLVQRHRPGEPIPLAVRRGDARRTVEVVLAPE